MGLQPLEFSDCLVDSPYFRDKLHHHEKELERTSKSIKQLITECKDLFAAAKNLSDAFRKFSKNLINFKFETIGDQQTDDEIVIGNSLKEFGKLIENVEDERDRMLNQSFSTFIHPLESFRKDNIGRAKEDKKKFDKTTAKYCQALEKHLNLKARPGNENELLEADKAIEMEKRNFHQASMQHVLLLQEVQERKKFEFVEILLCFMYQWMTFYHQGQEVFHDYKPYMSDLQMRLQITRESFSSTREEAEQLMMKMLGNPHEIVDKLVTHEGYLFLMEKKALGTTWTKVFCQYQKENKQFTIIPYTQTAGKLSGTVDTLLITNCIRRASDSIDKRFCFDVTTSDRPTFTLQSLSEEDRRLWLNAMDGQEPTYNMQAIRKKDDRSLLDDIGFNFVSKAIQSLESRGLEDQGLYRVVGVSSKVNKLLQMGLDKRKADKLNLEDAAEWETKTLTSAIKSYLRNLPEPLMSFELHTKFTAAAKQESKTLRIHDIHTLVHKLPEANFEMLDILIVHLTKVAEKSAINLMTISNLGVCFGPTLMRPLEETLSSIMDIKFCNIVVEILVEQYDKIFHSKPDGPDGKDAKLNSTQVRKNSNDSNQRPNNETPPMQKQSSHMSHHYSVAAARARFLSDGPPSLDRDSKSVDRELRSNRMTQSLNTSLDAPRSNLMTASTNTIDGPTIPGRPRVNPSESAASSQSSSGPGGGRPTLLSSSMTSSTTSSVNGSTPSTPPSTPTSSGTIPGGNSGGNTPSSVNSNPYAQARKMLKSTYASSTDPPERPAKPPDRPEHRQGSTSSSSESLNSKSLSGNHQTATAPNQSDAPVSRKPIYSNIAKDGTDGQEIIQFSSSPKLFHNSLANPLYENTHFPDPANRASAYEVSSQGPNANANTGKSDLAGFGLFIARKRPSCDGFIPRKNSSGSLSTMSEEKTRPFVPGGRSVRTIYSCEAENPSELSFEPNIIIYNVRQSREVGWLEGTLNGKTGLIPANYVEYLN
ncbi:rho GTPase-activating protein 26-like [Tubulanus polymorphus]|uniref:rho GTPase-activating protein 26-like n=1 Tax=Tubulanus polymorphus TaxID=672921 RepID=UPI003DA2D1D9